AEAHEITCAAEQQRLAFDRKAERHADAETDIFLEPGRTREALGGMDNLRKAAPARANPRPDLSAARGVLGHGHDERNTRFTSGRKRPADQASHLREPPADPAVEGGV